MLKKENTKWRLIKRILMFVPLFGLIVGFFYHKSEISRYKEQLSPKIECRYEYYSFLPKESYKFIIENIGIINCKNIWAQEKIYLIINGEVYKGDGVPHFNYFVYNGSRTRMWDLKREEKKEINLAELQIEVFYKLREKFNPTIISKWEINYSKEHSAERYHYEKYFIFDFEDRTFKDLKDYPGRVLIEDKIEEYLSLGSKMSVDIHYLTGDFEINPPQAFIVNPDYSIIPLYSGTKLRLEEFYNCICFYPGRLKFPPSDDISEGSVHYAWRFENDIWEEDICLETVGSEKPRIYLRPIHLETAYLSDEDAKRLITNPKYVHTIRIGLEYESLEKGKACISSNIPMCYQRDKEELKKDYFAEIIKKAREKYLDEKNNPK